MRRDWPELSGDEPCLLLLAADRQWALNCDVAPASFERSAQTFRSHPVFARAADSVRLSAGVPLATRELLARMPAAAHVESADSRNSDLPAGHVWLVLGSLEALIESHASFRRAGTDEWLSVALHEFLHAYQLRAPELAQQLASLEQRSRDAKRLKALFERNESYRAGVQREYALLVEAARQPSLDAGQARASLRAWLRLFRKRCSVLSRQPDGAGLLQTELFFSYLEGTARYVESKFLVDPGQHPAGPIAGDAAYHGFARFSGGGYAASNNTQLDAEYYYAIGFHVSWLLDAIDPGWKSCVHREPRWLVGLVERLTTAAVGAETCPRPRPAP